MLLCLDFWATGKFGLTIVLGTSLLSCQPKLCSVWLKKVQGCWIPAQSWSWPAKPWWSRCCKYIGKCPQIVQNVVVTSILRTDILHSYVSLLSLFHDWQGGELTVEVVGSSGVAAAWALHHYLHQHCGVQVTGCSMPMLKRARMNLLI